MSSRKIRFGMIGGEKGAFIGAIHRIASHLDDEYTLVCGAFSSDAEKSKESGQLLGINSDRIYASYQQLFERESALPMNRMEVVSIVTPNHLHFEPAKLALQHGFNVILDKPITFSLDEVKELKGILETSGKSLKITERSTHLQGQLVAVNPAYDQLFNNFAPVEVQGNPKARRDRAAQQLKYAAKASENLGLKAHATFSGSLLWPYIYQWPQRPDGLIKTVFEELGKRWKPILNEFDRHGVGMLVGFWIAGLITDSFRTADSLFNWNWIWLVPATIAVVVSIFFTIFFKDEGKSITRQQEI